MQIKHEDICAQRLQSGLLKPVKTDANVYMEIYKFICTFLCSCPTNKKMQPHQQSQQQHFSCCFESAKMKQICDWLCIFFERNQMQQLSNFHGRLPVSRRQTIIFIDLHINQRSSLNRGQSTPYFSNALFAIYMYVYICVVCIYLSLGFCNVHFARNIFLQHLQSEQS